MVEQVYRDALRRGEQTPAFNAAVRRWVPAYRKIQYWVCAYLEGPHAMATPQLATRLEDVTVIDDLDVMGDVAAILVATARRQKPQLMELAATFAQKHELRLWRGEDPDLGLAQFRLNRVRAYAKQLRIDFSQLVAANRSLFSRLGWSQALLAQITSRDQPTMAAAVDSVRERVLDFEDSSSSALHQAKCLDFAMTLCDKVLAGHWQEWQETLNRQMRQTQAAMGLHLTQYATLQEFHAAVVARDQSFRSDTSPPDPLRAFMQAHVQRMLMVLHGYSHVSECLSTSLEEMERELVADREWFRDQIDTWRRPVLEELRAIPKEFNKELPLWAWRLGSCKQRAVIWYYVVSEKVKEYTGSKPPWVEAFLETWARDGGLITQAGQAYALIDHIKKQAAQKGAAN